LNAQLPEDFRSPIKCELYHPEKTDKRTGEAYPGNPVWGFYNDESGWVSRYGGPGDGLWVCEGWRTYKSLDELRPSSISRGAGIQYEAGGTSVHGHETLLGMGRYRQSRFMPRWASRITLEVTAVRVERLHDISEEDAREEGAALTQKEEAYEILFAPLSSGRRYLVQECHRYGFQNLWCGINKSEWGNNPWVWVISFRRTEAKEPAA
jgi:hypothetical protein